MIYDIFPALLMMYTFGYLKLFGLAFLSYNIPITYLLIHSFAFKAYRHALDVKLHRGHRRDRRRGAKFFAPRVLGGGRFALLRRAAAEGAWHGGESAMRPFSGRLTNGPDSAGISGGGPYISGSS